MCIYIHTQKSWGKHFSEQLSVPGHFKVKTQHTLLLPLQISHAA